MKMTSKPNRDKNRVNMADATLKANMLSILNRECITKVKTGIKRNNDFIDNTKDDETYKKKQIDLIDLALETSTEMTTLFNSTQSNMKKGDTEQAAMT